MKQALNILIGYLTCTDPVIQNKWLNLLTSFWHKDAGWLLKSITAVTDGYKITVVDSDGNNVDHTISIPTIPNSQPINYIQDLETALDNKVDKAAGKGLSTNDFTTTLKTKLDNLNNYLHPDFHQISEIQGLQTILDMFAVTANLSTVAFSGDYNDLTNLPNAGGSTIDIETDETHADITALIADQNNQLEGELHKVSDASTDPTITSGWAIYMLNTDIPVGVIADYDLISKEEAITGGASETAASIKTKYESNPDTNPFTDAEKNKLATFESDLINQTRSYNKTQLYTPVGLVDASALAWDLINQTNAFLLATSGVGDNRTLPNTVISHAITLIGSNALIRGNSFVLTFKQDAVGGREILFENDYTVVGKFDKSPNAITKIYIIIEDSKALVVLTEFSGTQEPSQVTVTTSVDINSETISDNGYNLNGKNVLVQNTANNINFTVGETDNQVFSVQKEGTGNITFLASSGKTLREVDGTAVLDGVAGSTATVSVVGTIISLRISNAS